MSTLKGKGWTAFQRADGQWTFKFRQHGEWKSRRVPRRFTTDADVRRYVTTYLNERKRVATEAPRRSVVSRPGQISTDITFKDFAHVWTTGELAKLYPRTLKKKKSTKDDVTRLRKYINGEIGLIPVKDFEAPMGVEYAERVLRALPKKLADSTARQVAQVVRRVLQLAVYPAKILTVQPLPRGFLPSPGPEKAKTYLRPDEDALLMACTGIPLRDRLFFGLLAREGARIGEVRTLQLFELDLVHGSGHLDETKNGHPKDWALHPGTTRALIKWRDEYMKTETADAFVFSDENGDLPDRYEASEMLRAYVRQAGVTRPQLFVNDAKRIWLRVHDLRASFVTVALANGKSESWVADRTGHMSSAMINRYKRWARSHEELNLGDFVPLDKAIPEFRDAEEGNESDGSEHDADGDNADAKGGTKAAE